MSDASDCFYVDDGDQFVSGELTRGPWSNAHQHGGPPAALLGRAIERFGDDAAERQVARITFELFKPVPIAPLSIRVSLERPGKTVDRVAATLEHAGEPLMRALGVRIKERPAPGADAMSPAPELPSPEDLEPFMLDFFQHEVGYHRAVDGRFARGKWGDRDVIVWMRTLARLLPDEEPSALQRLLVMVDAESGICPPLNPRRFTFLNPDLSVHIERPFEGEWLGLWVRSGAHPNGVGLAESRLFDARGVVGRAAQSLVVSAR